MNTINLEQDWDIEKADKFVADNQVAKNMAAGEDDAYYSEWKFVSWLKRVFKKGKKNE